MDTVTNNDAGVEGQDRENYTDTQDRESYTVSTETDVGIGSAPAPVKRPRGRPKGSKNAPKDTSIVKEVSEVGTGSTPATPKKPRGRPKGSKNKPKDTAVVETVSDPVPTEALDEAFENAIDVVEAPANTVPVDPTTVDCVSCTQFIQCKKAKARNNFICEKFENEFPPIPEEEEEIYTDEDYDPTPQHICNAVDMSICEGCPHSVPHYPKDIHGDCMIRDEYCDDIQQECSCHPID
jgi:hypothetical protein